MPLTSFVAAGTARQSNLLFYPPTHLTVRVIAVSDAYNSVMFFTMRKFIPAIVLLLGLTLFAVTTWPLPVERMEWTANPTTSLQGEFSFALSWPISIRASEPRMARLTVKPPPGMPANTRIEARLEFPDLVIAPAGIMAQPVGAIETLEFNWEIEPVEAGVLPGTLWIYTSSLASGNSEEHAAFVARPLQVRAIFLGPVPVVWLRWVGIVLIALATVLFIRQAR